MRAERILEAIRAVAEPMAVLSACFLLVLALSWPVVQARGGLEGEQLARLVSDPLLLGIQAGVFLIAGLLLCRLRVEPRPGEARSGPGQALLLGAVGGVVALGASFGLSGLLYSLGLPVEEQAGLRELFRDPDAVLRIAPWVVVVMPVAEEVFFRGYAYRFMARNLGIPAGVILSSLMFAVVHLNPSGFLLYLMIGAVFAYVYQSTGRLITPIVAHAILNGVVLLTPLASPAVPDAPTGPAFTDVSRQVGVTFEHENGAAGEKLLPETMGGGVGVFDYDGDGDQDLLFVNSALWPGADPSGPAAPSLLRNDGSGRFDDVTAEAGLDVSLFGMGPAVGDYDGDGDVDLFLTAVGPNRLFRNDGGRFTDVSARAGVSGGAGTWSTSAGFADLDADGDLDLFVCNYVRWSREIDLAGGVLEGGRRIYAPPTGFDGVDPYLYRNEGNGRFSDASSRSGLRVLDPAGRSLSKALGVTFMDLDGDGFPEIFLANDTVPNLLFHNRGDGTFREIGGVAGFAVDARGHATGAMGIDAAHYRNDYAVAVAVGNFADEMTSLFVSRHDDLRFADEASAEGLGRATLRPLTFGLFFFDFDLDGRLDLFQANGHLEPSAANRYAQPAQLFRGLPGAGQPAFVEVGIAEAGDLAGPLVGRGAAYGDFDADGDLDVVVVQNGARAVLLRNDLGPGNGWVRLELEGGGRNPGAIGALVELTADGVTQTRQVMPTRSYLSQVELPLTFGLGTASRVDSVTVRWPDGSRQTENDVPVNRVVRIRQRTGTER